MKPLTDHLAITNDNSSHKRIRTHATPPTLGQFESALQVSLIHGS
jgi:hypothetical protein